MKLESPSCVNLIKLAPSAGFEIFKTLSPRPEYLALFGSAGSLGAAEVFVGDGAGSLDDSSGEAGELASAAVGVATSSCPHQHRCRCR